MHNLLIIASAHSADLLADSLRNHLDYSVQTAPDRAAALEALRRQEFSLIVVDEAFTGLDPKAADLLYKHAGAAAVLELNFVLSNVPRLTRQVRAALQRREQDRAAARAHAAVSLQGELGASLTSLLLESELALRSAPPALAPRLRHLVMLAGDLQSRLRA